MIHLHKELNFACTLSVIQSNKMNTAITDRMYYNNKEEMKGCLQICL